MLRHLLIKNFALIEYLELTLDNGLSIITGETGAGKSIMLGAIGLLTGAKADVKSLWDPAQKCIVEGQFLISAESFQPLFETNEIEFDAETVIRREILPSGKSRGFINDTPVTQDVLKTFGKQLLDIHSQHDSAQLGSSDFQLAFVDQFARNQSELSAFQGAFVAWQSAKQTFETLKKEAETEKASLDYNLFLLEQLQKADLQEQEDVLAEQELSVLDHSEELVQRLNLAYQALEGDEFNGLHQLKTAIQAIEKVGGLMPQAKEFAVRLQALVPEIRDVSAEIETLLTKVEADPQRQDQLNDRLAFLSGLKKRHQVENVDELILVKERLSVSVANVNQQAERLEDAKQIVEQAENNMVELGQLLTKSRKSVIEVLETELLGLLHRVALNQASIRIELTPSKPTLLGNDQVKILFTANKGTPQREIGQVASGGEFSRLMLCIKYILAKHTQLPTVIFDEIDTGISGEVALQVGKMVREMASNHQLMVITHLPQMAAQGKMHYYVYKDHSNDRTTSLVKQLNPTERIAELAQMMTGNAATSALKSAKELILLANQ